MTTTTGSAVSDLIVHLRAAVSLGRPLLHSDVDEIEAALATPAALRDLDTCPFCGGPADFDGSESSGYVVRCAHCGAKGGWGDYGYQAAKAWNKRTQLRTAASEGGEAVVWQYRFQDDASSNWAPWQEANSQESATRFAELYANEGHNTETRALYTHPPEVARDAADAERWRTLRDSLPKEYNHDKGYIRWYLPRSRGGFMGLQEHIDSIISSKSAISGAAGVSG